MQGKIIKGIAGFYYVHTGEDRVYECKAKGVFRNKNIKPLVGDNVIIDITDESGFTGNIVEVLPRKNQLIRPAVANIDQALVVFASLSPAPNFNLLGRFLVMMEQNEIDTIICFNKSDQVCGGEAESLCDIFNNSGCRTIVTSMVTMDGIEELSGLLKGKTTALAGPSGVGKSSILNGIFPEANSETGSISEKISRGRHTTRHSEIFHVGDETYIMDTPGFSSLDCVEMEPSDLRFYFQEFAGYEGKCRFNGCVHVNEPDCAVKDAVNAGLIHPKRYEMYIGMYNELKAMRKY